MVKRAKNDPRSLWPDPERIKKIQEENKFNPDSMILPLPFGRLNRVVELAGLTFKQVMEEALPDLDSRLNALSKHSQLASEVVEIKKMVAAKHIHGVEYLADWELRARLAEAELVGFYLDARLLPRKVDGERSRRRRGGKRVYQVEYEIVRNRCKEWVDGGMRETREKMLYDLTHDKALSEPEDKTIEGWWDAIKVELAGKRRKKITLPEI